MDKIYKSPKNWWFCDNERCKHPLGKIIRGDFMNVGLIEIEGKNGEKFQTRFNFIYVFCKKCGQKNMVYGGKIFSDEWKTNIRKFSESKVDVDDGWHDEFYANSFKRNALLKLLTHQEKNTFEFMQKHKDGEWTFDEGAKKLDISEEILSKNIESIDKKIIELDMKWRQKEIELTHKELEEIKRKWGSRKNP